MSNTVHSLAEIERRDSWLLMRILAAVRSAPSVAQKLIEEHGSVGAVLTLSEERLTQAGLDREGVAILALFREAVGLITERRVLERPVVRSGAQLADLLHPQMAHLPVEQFRAAYLDAAQRLIRIEVLGTGSVACAHVYPREIARRGLELSAAAVILAHNHPSGDPAPSDADILLSRRVSTALATVDIQLLDHLVIAREGHASAWNVNMLRPALAA